jgi:hypothetical protein
VVIIVTPMKNTEVHLTFEFSHYNDFFVFQ